MRRFLRALLLIAATIGFVGIVVVGSVGAYFYIQITEDLPQISQVSDYQPKAVTSILSSDGRVIGEMWDERRYLVEFSEIPEIVKKAFLAAEDANFYQHPGVDLVSVFRAVWVNFKRGGTRQGASTITQQIVKSLLLTREKTYERKIKEAILSYRIEKYLTKDEIFSIYLNEIYLGSGSYGVKAASRIHFHKELSELTVAEAAYLAGLPKKPSELSRIENRQMAIDRQRYVLRQMLEKKMISEDVFNEARARELVVFPQDNSTIREMPYFTNYVFQKIRELEASNDAVGSVIDPGGLVIETTGDVDGYNIAERSVKKGLRELDKRQGWRGPVLVDGEKNEMAAAGAKSLSESGEVESGVIYLARVLKKSSDGKSISVDLGTRKGLVDVSKARWAKSYRFENEKVRIINVFREISVGDVIEVSLDDEYYQENPEKGAVDPLRLELDQSPEVEGAFVITDPLTGEVRVIIGGYDYGRSVFNRATQALRQPGSSFKPFVYLNAIDRLNYTPATLVPDSPVSLLAGNGEVWSPQNYDRKYLGPITMRTALQRSRNVVSVHLVVKMGAERIISTARSFGVSTPIEPNLSIALGTSEVKLIEMVRAYGVFAASGWLADELVITSIKDRYGKEIYSQRPRQTRVISDETAFLMANMMKGVVERGTAQIIKRLERPTAGKTGTTNDQMDAWFIGYTPEIAAGAWVGYDVKRTLGRFETGGKAAAPIFLYSLQEYLKNEPDLDFDIPDGVIPASINLESGRLAEPGDPQAFIEYFKIGTEPRKTEKDEAIPQDYLSNKDF